jgi:hypothetical protein
VYDTRDENKAQKPRKLHLIPIRKRSWIEAKQIGIGIYKTGYNNIILKGLDKPLAKTT